MISPQWSCITGKGLAQDTTQPIATTQREVRALTLQGRGHGKGLVCSHCIVFHYFHPPGSSRDKLDTLRFSEKHYESWGFGKDVRLCLGMNRTNHI